MVKRERDKDEAKRQFIYRLRQFDRQLNLRPPSTGMRWVPLSASRAAPSTNIAACIAPASTKTTVCAAPG
jgi:hypothetical protein